MRGIMIQGTASDVGKSLIVTALCRLLANEGVKVAPFKSQNMSNNSYVTRDGKEIGRAQGIQAEAARIEPTVWMNPILLKPRSDQQAEVVYLGKALETLSGRGYRDHYYDKGINVIKQALNHLQDEYDVVVIEGAGSPVEINLKDRELVNMRVAELADVPVILVSDIDRGGVFASIVGTLDLMEAHERQRVVGVIINKFRGDLSLFEDGIQWLEEKTGIPVLGVLPYVENHMIDGEDSLSIRSQFATVKEAKLDIAVIRHPFISNYSDLEPFLHEDDVSLRWVDNKSEWGQPDAVILPGTKSTINDMEYLQINQLDHLIQNHVEQGGHVVGICGGYQMLGEEIIDEAGSDTGIPNCIVRGLGIIPAHTTFYREKETQQVIGTFHSGTGLPTSQQVEGYEIHLGKTIFLQQGSPFLLVNNGVEEGYFAAGGQIIGTYLHHLFHNDVWRMQWLNMLRIRKCLPSQPANFLKDGKDQRYDDIAFQLRSHLKWDLLKNLINQWDSR
ncbi:cobyric acid synthase [Neobacillus jeddahensis]|uniref:cobyric acid synthase n=1 Tax=Neobacillus jeddahensis TaxID=1461580 RepID=UPI00058E8802|nr:cobyric acid synthase [Neobacillus jeddahensis]